MRNITRREFVKNTALFTVATTVLPLHGCQLKHTLRFGLTTDSHYADTDTKGTRFYRGALQKMEAFVSVMNQEQVDFVMHLGDFKDEDAKQNKQDTLHYLKTIETSYSKFKGPKYHCIGNHDVDSITKQEFLGNIINTGISKDKSYYSFDASGFHFVVLDANYDQRDNDHFFAEGADWEDTNIPQTQLKWLQDDLSKNTLPTIVFCHHPLFEYFRGGNKYHVNNYKEVQSILESANSVVGVFQGHVHEEKYKQIQGIHYVTQWGMVDFEGLENNSFAIVEINHKGIIIKGFKRASSKRIIS